jgi:hypothetical protein
MSTLEELQCFKASCHPNARVPLLGGALQKTLKHYGKSFPRSDLLEKNAMLPHEHDIDTYLKVVWIF